MYFGQFPFGQNDQYDDDQYDGEGQQQQDNNEPKDNNVYYQLLGIQKDATEQTIKQSYIKLANDYHPDKQTGNAEKFQKITQAYQILSNPQKRMLYDQFGSKAFSEDPNQMMNMYLNQGSKGKSGKTQLPKVQPTRQPLKVSLQTIYHGGSEKIEFKRIRICQGCSGKGGEDVVKCQPCKGRGQIVQMIQVGPGMYQQIQQYCSQCKGLGEMMQQDKKCKICVGKKYLQKTATVDVQIQKGTPTNHAITVPGQGSQIPQTQAGDLIIITQQQQHPIFKRIGADLHMKKHIKLYQALLGVKFTLKHINGKQYLIKTKPCQIIGDFSKKIVIGLGMPFYKNSQKYGNLIIQFTVKMPDKGQLTKQQIEVIKRVLPGQVNERPKGDYEMLEDFDLQNVNTNEQGGRKSKQQEQYENETGTHVDCGTQ